MKNRYLVFNGVWDVALREEELPARLPAGAVLVRSEYTFISAGTELANLTGQEPKVFQPGSWCAYPWRPGYAQVGRVTAIGEGVSAWKVGDRVFTLGAHAECMVRTGADLMIQVPEGVDALEAVASRLAGVAFSAVVAEAPVWFDRRWVAVCGLGMVGNLAGQCYRALGARVVGVDPVESRRKLAEACGFERSLRSLQELPEQPALIIEATGRGEVAVQAVNAVGNHGHVVLLGTPRAPHTGDVTGLLSAIHLRNLTIHGALEWSLPAEQPAGFNNPASSPTPNLTDKQRLLFDWIVDGRLKVRPLISHVVKPSEAVVAYRGLLEQPETYTGVAIDWR